METEATVGWRKAADTYHGGRLSQKMGTQPESKVDTTKRAAKNGSIDLSIMCNEKSRKISNE
jgi:hypothetical protein